MLIKIKKYILLHGRVSLSDLAIHFQVDVGVMEKMLEVWIKKNKIKKNKFDACSTACFSCSKNSCSKGAMTFYEWVD